MAEVDIDVGTRRRLPLWMLGVTASDQLRKAENEDENEPSLALGDASQAPQPKKNRTAKRPDKEIILPDKDSLVVDSSLLVKCAAEERKRKSGRREVDRNGRIYSEGDLQKKRAKRTDGIEKTIQKPARQKKKKGKSYRVQSMGAIGAPSLTEEDGELTMEDLMSIAEEYVQADEEMDHQQSKAESKSKTQLPTTIISADELDCSLEATHTSGRSSTHTTMGRPTSDLTETRLKAQDDLASEGIVVNLNRTGDPTQDMLDLFLGPLLKKPQSDERKLELTMEDMTLAYEFREQSQNKVVGEEVVPLLKKKSSLKDKVAMFLD